MEISIVNEAEPEEIYSDGPSVTNKPSDVVPTDGPTDPYLQKGLYALAQIHNYTHTCTQEEGLLLLLPTPTLTSRNMSAKAKAPTSGIQTPKDRGRKKRMWPGKGLVVM